jgi:hypothetical protein
LSSAILSALTVVYLVVRNRVVRTLLLKKV